MTNERAKSVGMPVSKVCQSNEIAQYGFRWIPLGVKYLGIHLNPNLDKVMLSNMEPLLQKIKLNLEKWGKLKLTLWGKINVIRMVVAPQFNYVSMMLPVSISPNLFKQYDSIVKDFLWDKKKPRINIKKICSPRDIGGHNPLLCSSQHFLLNFDLSYQWIRLVLFITDILSLTSDR